MLSITQSLEGKCHVEERGYNISEAIQKFSMLAIGHKEKWQIRQNWCPLRWNSTFIIESSDKVYKLMLIY